MGMTNRRNFLTAVAAGSALSWQSAQSAERPPVSNPRATSGDQIHEPDWEVRFTVTVGQGRGDLQGSDQRVIQAAVDYVARLGGGTVKILPGRYRFRNAVYLASGVRLIGSGAETVLVKQPSTTVPLTEDSDWYDQEITLADARSLQLGDGICLRTKNPHNGGSEVLKRTLIARNGNRFKLDRALRKNLWLTGKPTCSTLFPLFSGEHIQNVTIEDLTFDGNRQNHAHLDGNYGGCIWMQDCNGIQMRRLTTHHNNGDGISWQICHDVVVEDCHSHDNADLGLHPGSGSQRPLIQNNLLERNGIGIFWCWGVKHGLAEANRIFDSRNYGISIGHNDTDNRMKNNRVERSGKVGILFRDDSRGKDFWPNRNHLENNQIIDSGNGKDGIAIDLQGKTKDIVILGNQLRETRNPAARIGIRIGPNTQNIQLMKNKFAGLGRDVEDRRAS